MNPRRTLVKKGKQERVKNRVQYIGCWGKNVSQLVKNRIHIIQMINLIIIYDI
jgi:hypothetical protein